MVAARVLSFKCAFWGSSPGYRDPLGKFNSSGRRATDPTGALHSDRAVADCAGLPISVCVTSASPHEVTLVEATLAGCFVSESPERLIGDRAYDNLYKEGKHMEKEADCA